MALFAAVLAAWNYAPAPVQGEAEPKDRIERKKPAAIIGTVKKEMQALKGYRLEYGLTTDSGGHSFTGAATPKDALAHLEGTREMWAKGEAYAVKGTEVFENLDETEGFDAVGLSAVVNPEVILRECLKAAADAGWAGDEAVGDIPCKVLELKASSSQKKEQAAAYVRRYQMNESLGLAGRVDTRATKSAYRVWIGISDLRVYKIEWALTPRFDLSNLPSDGSRGSVNIDALGKLEAVHVLTLSAFDKDVELAMPKDVAKVLR